MATILELAIFSRGVYADPEIFTKWELIDVSDDNENGYYGQAYINRETKEIVITHRGTRMPDLKDLANDGKLTLLIQHSGQDRAVEFAREIAQLPEYADYKIINTGHSLGGNNAQAATAFLQDELKRDVSAVTFNSPGIGGYSFSEPKENYRVLNLYAEGDAINYAGGTHLGFSYKLDAGPAPQQFLPTLLLGFTGGLGLTLSAVYSLYNSLVPGHSIETIVSYLKKENSIFGANIWEPTGTIPSNAKEEGALRIGPDGKVIFSDEKIKINFSMVGDELSAKATYDVSAPDTDGNVISIRNDGKSQYFSQVNAKGELYIDYLNNSDGSWTFDRDTAERKVSLEMTTEGALSGTYTYGQDNGRVTVTFDINAAGFGTEEVVGNDFTWTNSATSEFSHSIYVNKEGVTEATTWTDGHGSKKFTSADKDIEEYFNADQSGYRLTVTNKSSYPSYVRETYGNGKYTVEYIIEGKWKTVETRAWEPKLNGRSELGGLNNYTDGHLTSTHMYSFAKTGEIKSINYSRVGLELNDSNPPKIYLSQFAILESKDGKWGLDAIWEPVKEHFGFGVYSVIQYEDKTFKLKDGLPTLVKNNDAEFTATDGLIYQIHDSKNELGSDYIWSPNYEVHSSSYHYTSSDGVYHMIEQEAPGIYNHRWYDGSAFWFEQVDLFGRTVSSNSETLSSTTKFNSEGIKLVENLVDANGNTTKTVFSLDGSYIRTEENEGVHIVANFNTAQIKVHEVISAAGKTVTNDFNATGRLIHSETNEGWIRTTDEYADDGSSVHRKYEYGDTLTLEVRKDLDGTIIEKQWGWGNVLSSLKTDRPDGSWDYTFYDWNGDIQKTDVRNFDGYHLQREWSDGRIIWEDLNSHEKYFSYNGRLIKESVKIDEFNSYLIQYNQDGTIKYRDVWSPDSYTRYDKSSAIIFVEQEIAGRTVKTFADGTSVDTSSSSQTQKTVGYTFTDQHRVSAVWGSEDADVIQTDAGTRFIAGREGDDTITLSTGESVIAFNLGDGKDVLQGTNGANAVLSIALPAQFNGLSLSKIGNDLIFKLGTDDQITIKDWYSFSDKSIERLQFVHNEFTVDGQYVGFDQRFSLVDFVGLVQRFDSELVRNGPNCRVPFDHKRV
ncbi:DUF2974 domain-containing protein [Massilia sp. UMI-21]|nr:DUF2974 domain-containing protein [Massilia sp. UMI-21]